MIGSENGLTSEASHQRASVSAPPPERKASAMLEEAADNQPFGGCLEGHPTWPLSPGQGKASRAQPEGQGVGPCWPGPSRAQSQSQRASPTSLARNTVFPFSKDGKGTSGPRLSSLDSVCYKGLGKLAQLPPPPPRTPKYLLPPSERTHFRGCESRLGPSCNGRMASVGSFQGLAMEHITIFLFKHLWIRTAPLGVAFRWDNVKMLSYLEANNNIKCLPSQQSAQAILQML